MRYFLSRGFQKQFRKLPARTKQKALAQIELFVANPMDSRLRNHPLAGEWRGCRGINITGDIRAVYKEVNADIVQFVAIGSHSELYEIREAVFKKTTNCARAIFTVSFSSMATRTKKIERENVAVRILIFEERGAWFGVALEMNLVVEAKTQAQAYKRLIDAINGYVAALKQEHVSYDLLRGTPDKEYETLWRKGMTLYGRHRAARATLHGHTVLSPFQVGFQLVR